MIVPNFDRSTIYPTIISVHPFGSCKEQTSGSVYGKALAEQGFVVIAHDVAFRANAAARRVGSGTLLSVKTLSAPSIMR